MPNGPIRAKQLLCDWLTKKTGQADTTECTVVQCSCVHSSTVHLYLRTEVFLYMNIYV